MPKLNYDRLNRISDPKARHPMDWGRAGAQLLVPGFRRAPLAYKGGIPPAHQAIPSDHQHQPASPLMSAEPSSVTLAIWDHENFRHGPGSGIATATFRPD